MNRKSQRFSRVAGVSLTACTIALGTWNFGCSRNDTDRGEAKRGRPMSDRLPPEGKNRLAFESSPYLLQHADNPVDWYPWGEAAFEKARREDKPIFLSIGYSTCHWCHVMEHESFEDSTIAALMNDAFVNVKVDREERPDVDNVYMTICQMMTGSGGWPLTIIMTPDKKPFFAATYIPPEDRFGNRGMRSFIPLVKDLWQKQRDKLVEDAAGVAQRLGQFVEGREAGDALEQPLLGKTFEQLSQRYDEKHGGFGSAPKFPTPHNLLFLLRYWHRSNDARALEMVENTLQALARGGIYDHVGFGFHRYSTDARWFAPHFEKMLYDQALLVMAFTEAYQATGNAEYRRVASEVIHYVQRDMTDEAGGFYSAEDADSEGIEGKFYLWSEAEVRGLLGADADWVIDLFGIEANGNFAQEVDGGNILHLRRDLPAVADERGEPTEALLARLGPIRERMRVHRAKRVAPYKDDKILTDWNGLMIAALAKAGRAFDDPSYTDAAERAVAFILETMHVDGRLLHRYRAGEAGIAGTIDDYAFMIWGLLELYETTARLSYLETALTLNGVLLSRFWDEDAGGLFFTPDDGEALIVRMKEAYDGAVPSGNSVAMLNLVRLSRLTGDHELETRAEAIGKAFHEDVTRSPAAFTLMMTGLDLAVGPSYEIVIVGEPDAEDTRGMRRSLAQRYLPNKVVLVKPTGKASARVVDVAAFTAAHAALDGRATAYVCRNFACELPTTDVAEMLRLLGADPSEN